MTINAKLKFKVVSVWTLAIVCVFNVRHFYTECYTMTLCKWDMATINKASFLWYFRE